MGTSSLQIMEDGQFYACHQDEQGSTIYITGRDEAVENCYVYDAFGNSLEKKEGIQNRIQYTGQQYDQETGQYYLRARYYNPAVGRFTQEDTYRGDGLNLYAYCKNNPVVYYDPSGHDQAVNPSNGPETTNTAGVEKGNIETFSANDKSGLDTSTYKAPEIIVNSKGELTNGQYTLNQADMQVHIDGKNPGKSQFLYDVDANKAVLDAAAYADANHLWEAGSGNAEDFANKAKVYVENGPVGVTGKGELTDYINVYRTKTGYIHGCPGNS